jgi:hypothetical protein
LANENHSARPSGEASAWSHPATELRIRQDDDVFAVPIGSHLAQEGCECVVEPLRESLLCCPLVGVGVEPAELHGVHAGGHAGLDALGDHVQLRGQ